MPVPPPPPPPMASAPSASQDGRGMLLQSIRAGKSLKKTVTNDKSAPAIGGKVRNDSSSAGAPPFRGGGGSGGGSSASGGRGIGVANNGGAPALGGLFSGGMPKLKPTGLRSNMADKDSGRTETSSSSVTSGTPVSPAPSVKRGPPPVPPPATQKPQISPESQSPMTAGNAPEAPASSVVSKGFGKPMLAPKPPPPPVGAASVSKPSPPPKKLGLLSGPSVSRAQSMRLPRSPPVIAPVPSSLHQSQDFLNESQHSRPMMNRALRPPVARPPSPPTSKTFVQQQTTAVTTTRVAPPPPSRLTVTAPSMPPPPPPPPYRSTSMHQRLAPPPPPPPTPPTRVASAGVSTLGRSNGQSSTLPMATPAPIATNTVAMSIAPPPPTTTAMTTTGPILTAMTMHIDLEVRFADKFHSISNFPNPSPFRGFPKVYNSKNAAKQQAPAPPLQSTSTPGTVLQLNASSGGKQWQHTAAASSAC